METKSEWAPGLAEQIKDVLLEVCPKFEYKKNAASATWLCCHCAISGGYCTCVWHRTDTCEAGAWPQLGFLVRIHGGGAKETKAAIEDAEFQPPFTP